MSADRSSDSLSPCTLIVPAQIAYLSLIDEMVQWFARQVGLGDEERRDLSLIVDEASTNVMSYAYPPEGLGELHVVCTPMTDRLEVTLIDRGMPFDPKDGLAIGEEKRTRDPVLGGRGLMLVYQLADEARYSWDEDTGNQFTLVKRVKSKGRTSE